MATNPWISQSVRNEQNLYEDLVIESLKFYGQDVYYLPREIVNKDKVFLDDVPSRFSDAYKVEMYVENIDGFAGEGDLFSKFGVELRDQATFIVARRRWKTLIGDKLDSYNFRPREGDLLYIPFSQSIFEIFKVETETPFYQLNQLPTFRLQCELFEYNDEDFDTDIDGIDDVEEESAYQYKLTMEQPSIATATVTTDVTLNGEVINPTIVSAGRGYSSAPTITVSSNPGTNSKFGNASLNVSRGRGIERNYLLNGNDGTIEMWIYANSLPQSGQQALFVTGGTSSTLNEKYIWGVNNLGHLVYSRGDNLGGGVVTPTESIIIETSTWHHIVIGVEGSQMYIYFDGENLHDANYPSTTFNWFTTDAFSIGADAARTVDGVQWNAFTGYIDDFRARVGSRSTLMDDRYSAPGNSAVINEQTTEWDSDANTAYLNNFNATNAVLTGEVTNGALTGIITEDAGLYYDNPPTITVSQPYSGGIYKRNEVVEQDNGTYTMKGEVAKWDSASGALYLAHVGSTDGLYHTFSTTLPVVGEDATYAPSLVEELQQIQEVDTGIAQNQYFDDFESDFLDFSESNPFGDMS
jgi:hypothetical protein